MDRTEVKAKLEGIFRDVFSDDTLAIREETTAADVPGWDSLRHIDLIVAVEKGFGVTLTTREVRSMKNVGDMMELVLRKAR